MQSESTQLKETLTKFEDQLQDTEQWLRANNVEIKGVPMRDKVNLFDVITKLGQKISYTVTKSSINFIHRVPTFGSSDKNIIASFTSKYAKEDFVAAARASKDPILPSDLGLSGKGKIFVNDHLTSKNKARLSKVKALAKAKGYQFVWVKHMKICVRRDPTSKVFVINSDLDLQKIS
ncbi:hypothetical protein ACJJTC_007646 [Scirpophaga incertulas]